MGRAILNEQTFQRGLRSHVARWPKLLATLLCVCLLGQMSLHLVAAQQRRAQRRANSRTATLNDEQRIRHVLARLSFGARPGDAERVRALGVEAYIAQQLDPDAIDDSALEPRLKLPTLALATPTLIEQYNPPKPAATPTPTPSPSPSPVASPSPSPTATRALAAQSGTKNETQVMPMTTAQQNEATTTAKPTAKPQPTPMPRNPQQVVTELQRASFLRAVYSERQLNELLVDFWENHFSIYAQKDADRWLLTSFERDAIRPFALGRFRDLLGATAHSPAMLFYLDNWQSSVLRKYPATKDKPARQTGGINENYARELMELHTLGVDGGYTQKDVQEVARCFTGWTIRKPNEEGLFMFNPAAHDNGEKIVLGQKIPAGGGISDGERVLDILARHPSTAHFIATKLARRFIADDPPASVVERAAAVFLKTDGSIRETVRAIITAPEFFAPNTYRAKMRSPFEYAAAAVRALAAETDGNRPLLDWLGRMGQPVFGRVTPDGYPDRAQQWLSTGALLARLNFASALANNQIKGTHVDAARLLANADLNDPRAIAERLTQLALGGDVSAHTLDDLAKAADLSRAPAPAAAPANNAPPIVLTTKSTSAPVVDQSAPKSAPAPAYIAQMITLVIGAPEFQRR